MMPPMIQSVVHPGLVSAGRARFAGVCAMLVGAAYLASQLTFRLTPHAGGPPEDVLTTAKFAPGWFIAYHGELALAGLLGLAVVAAVSDLTAPGSPVWMDWARRVGYFAFAVVALENVRLAALVPQMGNWYLCHCTSQEQIAVVVSFSTLPLDPFGVITLGLVALWIASVCLAGRRAKSLPAGLVYLGLVLAVLYLAAVITALAGEPGLHLLGLILSSLLSGVWYLWLGWRLASTREETLT
jgi:hypothetical protein